jgi:hypothetical protein
MQLRWTEEGANDLETAAESSRGWRPSVVQAHAPNDPDGLEPWRRSARWREADDHTRGDVRRLGRERVDRLIRPPGEQQQRLRRPERVERQFNGAKRTGQTSKSHQTEMPAAPRCETSALPNASSSLRLYEMNWLTMFGEQYLQRNHRPHSSHSKSAGVFEQGRNFMTCRDSSDQWLLENSAP